MFKITYFGFNEDELQHALRKTNRISKAVCAATCCKEDDLIFAIQPTFNGKRHVEVLPLNEPSDACEKAVQAIHSAGYNAILLPSASLVYWKNELERN